MARADPPQALARDALIGVVIGQRFARQQIAVIVKPGCHRIAAQRDVVAPAQIVQQRLDDRLPAFVIDRGAPAPMRVLFQHDHPATLVGGITRRRQPGNAAAHHHQIGMGIGLLITVGVAVLRRPAQTGAAADDRLEQVFPEGARMDEGLVIEARRQQWRQPVIDRHQIGLQRGPAVLAAQDHARHQGRGGGALVRLEPAALPQPEQRVGFLGPRGDGAARAVIFEAAAHQHLAVGQEGRGDGVADHAAQMAAIETEGQLPCAVDQAATLRQPEGAGLTHSACFQSGFQSGRAALTAATISSGGFGCCAL